MRYWHKTSVLAVTLLSSLIATTAAKGEQVDAKLNQGHIWGTVTVHKDVVSWDLQIRDTKPNDKGVNGKIVLDREVNLDSIDYRSNETSGGKVLKWKDQKGKKENGPIRGARLHLCEEGDCREVAYIPER
jgi:hypothetical protein